MKCLEINNYVNEDDITSRPKSCANAKNLSKMDRKLMDNDRKELLVGLLGMLTSDNRSAINNKLTSKTEIMNLINTLRSSKFKKQFDQQMNEQWKTPLIEDFLPASEDSNDSSASVEELNWNNSELNYYDKDIIEELS